MYTSLQIVIKNKSFYATFKKKLLIYEIILTANMQLKKKQTALLKKSFIITDNKTFE